MTRIRIWDWPTRVTHWMMAALVFFSWGSAEYHQMALHRYSGYALLGLLFFRIYWGLFGSATARFANFVKGPRTIWAYLHSSSSSSSEPSVSRLEPRVFAGHNPLGALSVIVLLLLLMTQVTLGLFAVDIDGLESGPLSHLVSFDAGRKAAEAHEIVFNVLLGFIVVHVAAIFYYLLIKRDNLIAPMITGKKSVPDSLPDPVVVAPIVRITIGIVFAAVVVWLIV